MRLKPANFKVEKRPLAPRTPPAPQKVASYQDEIARYCARFRNPNDPDIITTAARHAVNIDIIRNKALHRMCVPHGNPPRVVTTYATARDALAANEAHGRLEIGKTSGVNDPRFPGRSRQAHIEDRNPSQFKKTRDG